MLVLVLVVLAALVLVVLSLESKLLAVCLRVAGDGDHTIRADDTMPVL